MKSHANKSPLALIAIFLLAAAVLFGILAFRAHTQRNALAQQLTTAQEQINSMQEEIDAYEAVEETESEPTFDYQSLYPDLYVTHPSEMTRTENTIYLTFDDGPSMQTEKILATLRQYNVKATFFVVGTGLESESGKALLKEIAADGHTIGVHTYSHDYRDIYASVDNYLADFDKVYNQVYEITGEYPTIFRFPGGSINGYNGTFYQQLIAEMERRGFVYYDWDVSSEDAAGADTAAAITNNVLSHISGSGRSFVLLHDSGAKAATAEALPSIIQGLQKKGYSFAAITNDVSPLMFGYRN